MEVEEKFMTLTLAPDTEARLLAAAAEKGLAPEEVIDVLLKQNGKDNRPAGEAEQARLQKIFTQLQADALALETKPAPVRPDRAPEEVMYGEIITEKYRKQGFNLP